MSTLEFCIWYTLGYLAMPLIILVGFIGVAVISVSILSFWEEKNLS